MDLNSPTDTSGVFEGHEETFDSGRDAGSARRSHYLINRLLKKRSAR